MIARAPTDDACHPDVVRIVILEEVLAARRVGYWRHQPRRRGDDLVMGTRAAGACINRDPIALVENRCDLIEVGITRAN